AHDRGHKAFDLLWGDIGLGLRLPLIEIRPRRDVKVEVGRLPTRHRLPPGSDQVPDTGLLVLRGVPLFAPTEYLGDLNTSGRHTAADGQEEAVRAGKIGKLYRHQIDPHGLS